ncbi:MAG: hypothetical protein KatS3mg076_1272 [Candidatus Binatia bacterium]|nr:MAG: hypothetical protein KatS3mg076_1272 [Candidatus Binatia bacterium]
MLSDELIDEEQRIAEEAAQVGTAILTKPIGLIQHPAVTVSPSASVAEAVRRMVEHKVGCVLVEDGGKLVGIFTERDVLVKVLAKVPPEATRVGDLMTSDPETLPPDAKIAFALNKMSVGGFRHIPVVEADGKPVGVVSMRDIVNYVVDLFPDEVLNLPPDPSLQISRTREGA